MSHYADELEVYYNSRNVSSDRVRVDKERAFTKYSTMEVWLNDIEVKVDPSGERAVTTALASDPSAPSASLGSPNGRTSPTWG